MCWGNNLNALEWAEDKKVGVASYDVSCLPTHSVPQELVVFGIVANRYL